ncbi:hypothetical protein [Armatimonas sp.]|uniref:hypothetical protein n=1 Tax=Armatimonas sp. TaxID=1872638 RepID=UPI0037501E02
MTRQTNLATAATLRASSSLNAGYGAANLTDGKLTNESRWVSGSMGPHTLMLTWATPQTIGCLQLGTGWLNEGVWGSEFRSLSVRDGSGHELAKVTGNDKTAVELRFTKPVTTDTFQLVFADPGTVRLVEVRVFAPATTYPPLLLPGAIPRPRPVPLFLNQTGYDPDSSKRFTAPTLPDGTPFVVKQGDKAIFQGTIRSNIGDFTALKAAKGEVRIEAAGLLSDPFEIAPLVTLRASLDPALRFFVDNRSLIGTHPSAYGGSAWRDGTYYSYEVPSLVMLYLANPSFFEQAKREVEWKPLAPNFKQVKANGDGGALEAAQAYFREIEPPKPASPDIVKLIHWGVGWHLVKPESADPSGDPKGKRLHPQTIEQLAFFIYAWPQLSDWLPGSLYERTKAFVLTHWNFGIQTEVGDFKGRECPGHSILPNVLLYEATKDKRFLDTAIAQAKWVCEKLDPADPKVTKGQRMSEHMLITGMTVLLPHAEALIRPWLEKWADVMIARSENAYDFRKYDEANWTLPRFTPGSHGGAGWNEPGNIAGFPACALSVARLTGDKKRAERLRVIATAHFDALFGRNPLGAHAAFRGPKDFYGVERGWPKKFADDTCARLELVRGTLSSTAASEHYPNNPDGPFRHPEGWTAFNSAFNVGLAYACREATWLTRKGKIVTLQAPVFAPTATVTVGKTTVRLKAINPEQTLFQATTNATGTLRYGHGFLATEE